MADRFVRLRRQQLAPGPARSAAASECRLSLPGGSSWQSALPGRRQQVGAGSACPAAASAYIPGKNSAASAVQDNSCSCFPGELERRLFQKGGLSNVSFVFSVSSVSSAPSSATPQALSPEYSGRPQYSFIGDLRR